MNILLQFHEAKQVCLRNYKPNVIYRFSEKFFLVIFYFKRMETLYIIAGKN